MVSSPAVQVLSKLTKRNNLQPSSAQPFAARLNPCPSFDSLFPSCSGTVQIDQAKKSNLDRVWVGSDYSAMAGGARSSSGTACGRGVAAGEYAGNSRVNPAAIKQGRASSSTRPGTYPPHV